MRHLVCSVLLLSMFFSQAQAQKIRATLRVVAVNIDKNFFQVPSFAFVLKFRLLNTCSDTLFKADTIYLFTSDEGGEYLMSKYVLSDSFVAPNNEFSFKQLFSLSSLDNRLVNNVKKPIKMIAMTTKPHVEDTIFGYLTHNIYIDDKMYINSMHYENLVIADSTRTNKRFHANAFTKYIIPEIEKEIDKQSCLEIDHFLTNNCLSFTYKNYYVSTYKYSITDHLGKIVSLGFIDLTWGENKYTIETTGFKSGRYTLKIEGEYTTLYGNFTIL